MPKNVRTKLSIMLAATGVAAAGLATAVPAQAAAPDHGNAAVPASVQTFKNLGTGDCLQNTAGAGGLVNAYACDGSSDQQWSVSSIGSYRVLRNVATGLCLDYSKTYDVRAIGCNNGNWQQWLPSRQSDGTIGLVNKATGGCLGDGKQVFVHPCDMSRRDLRWY